MFVWQKAYTACGEHNANWELGTKWKIILNGQFGHLKGDVLTGIAFKNNAEESCKHKNTVCSQHNSGNGSKLLNWLSNTLHHTGWPKEIQHLCSTFTLI